MFDDYNASLIFYGHNHEANDIQGNGRYVNLGSAGCFSKPEVRLGILDISEGQLIQEKQSVPYNDEGLMEAYEIRKVRARAFVKSVFIVRK